jgi:hypothetical protein
MLNPKKYPLHLATTLEQLLNKIRKTVDDNFNTIEIVDDPHALIRVEDKEKEYKFRFRVLDATSGGAASFFQTEFLPQNKYQSTIPHQQKEGLEATIAQLNRWVSTINTYGLVNLNDLKNFTNRYADEIFADFEILDEPENYRNPIDSKMQEVFFKRLKEISEAIKQSDEYQTSEELKEIAEETSNLADDLPKLSIYQAGKIWAKISAKAKSYKLGFFEKLYEAGQKEIYKQIFLFGAHGLIQFGSDLTKLLT